MKYHDANEFNSKSLSSEVKLTRQPGQQQHQQVQEQSTQSVSYVNNQDSDCQSSNATLLSNGLPRKFITALKGLFNILDDSKSGFIKLAELEVRWRDVEADTNVPKGLIECLQSFQIANELIDFERFCQAVHLCLSRGNKGPSSPPLSSSSASSAISSSLVFNQQHHNEPGKNTTDPGPNKVTVQSDLPPTINQQELIRPPMRLNGLSGSTELLGSSGDTIPEPTSHVYSRSFTSDPVYGTSTTGLTCGPLSSSSKAIKTQSFDDMCKEDEPEKLEFRVDFRAKSMPQLREATITSVNGERPVTTPETSSTAFRHYSSDAKICDDIKAQRIPMRNKIINILKEWRNTVIQKNTNQVASVAGPPPIPPELPSSVTLGPGTSIAPSLASNLSSTLSQVNQITGIGSNLSMKPKSLHDDDDEWGFASGSIANVTGRSRHGKRREARRHTVSSGIDINTIKRLQQYEQEKEILLQGLEMIERGRDWYIKSINAIQGKIRFIGQAMANAGDYSLDANQERINFQAARILTVNQHLAALMDNSRGFPVHMNLALRPLLVTNQARFHLDSSRSEALNNVTIQRLKEQNRLLTEEVSLKSEKITILEREKSALIRELFQTRSVPVQKSYDDNDDNTFM